MKKIIATVLAMVMALALCTTAFAAVKYTGYDKNGDVIKVGETEAVFSYETEDGDYDKVGNDNSVDYFAVTNETYAATVEGYTAGKYLKADSKDFDLKLTAPGKADLYLKEATNGVTYYAVGTEFTNIGKKCDQLNGSKSNTYYKATYLDEVNEELQIEYFVKATTATGKNLLVDGKLVAVSPVSGLNGHTWKAATYDADDNVTTFKCKDCDTVATVYKTMDAAKASGAAVYVKPTTGAAAGLWIAYTDGTTATDTKTDGTTSPKTFDAGIAMYVGMALTSVAGSAVVIGKKKEF